MSRPQTYEQVQLYEAEQIIRKNTSNFKERMLFLESFAAIIGGVSVEEYWRKFGIVSGDFVVERDTLEAFRTEIEKTDIPFAMAISAMAREPLSVENKKKNGVFYTDYRLAKLIAESRFEDIKEDSKVVDFAAGTGILLVGIATKYKEKFEDKFNDWISKNLYAFDLSENALRGATIALMSLTEDVQALKEMVCKWKVCDSLLDIEIENIKFDIVVGNPPWGKIKVSRHLFALREGKERVYGADYANFDYEKYEEERDGLAQYSKDIKYKYKLLEKAEPDMYMAFLQKAIMSADEKKGKISFLVPAGLIRSKGTKCIREFLCSNSKKLEINLFDNKGSFFSIDSRFKFLLVSVDNGGASRIDNIGFSICSVEGEKIKEGQRVRFDLNELERIRPDLTIPEVRTSQEKDIFYKIVENGISWGDTDGIWQADISREVDMTNDKNKFLTTKRKECLPVIEGRMIQQYRFGVKTYVSGSGRSAIWNPCVKNGKAQFFIKRGELNEVQIKRTEHIRAGYCDIAGQTNERAMMSAIIPQGVVCGNKVPTVIFPNASEDILYLWIGITNSFVFDWMIRRIISTTVNYFLLFSIPMPNIEVDSDIAKRIIANAKKLSVMGTEYYQKKMMQKLRVEIDLLVAQAYGLEFEEIEIIMDDFPSIDRRQPALDGEQRSTITRDCVLSAAEKKLIKSGGIYSKRYRLGQKLLAKAYIPTEMVVLCEGGTQNG